MEIEPINQNQQQQIVDCTLGWIDRAGQLMAKPFTPVTVAFDLKGRSAGMYKVRNGSRVIRYNPYLFAKYYQDNLSNTVPHEVAHYVTDCLYGIRNIQPHGAEWVGVMNAFGVEANVTGIYDLDGVPVRRFKQFEYHCGCKIHQLTSRRHNKLIRGAVRYFCRECGNELLLASVSS